MYETYFQYTCEFSKSNDTPAAKAACQTILDEWMDLFIDLDDFHESRFPLESAKTLKSGNSRNSGATAQVIR
jgi:hypothetical protein